MISGKTEYLREDYPDIRTVPEKKDADLPRSGLPIDEEKALRKEDFKTLEEAREKIRARDQALRESGFPTIVNPE